MKGVGRTGQRKRSRALTAQAYYTHMRCSRAALRVLVLLLLLLLVLVVLLV